MPRTPWKLPVPSTALLDGGPRLDVRPRREIILRLAHEVDDGEREVLLHFRGVEAYKVTHHHARSEAMLIAYDKLVDIGDSDWLREVRTNLQHHGDQDDGLAHLMLNFDHGPCYEFICRGCDVNSAAR